MRKTQQDKIKTLREKERTSFKRKIIQLLYDEMRTSSLGMRIEEVAASRLWNRGIGSISAVVYFQQNDSRRLIV
jgi:hypothetical protein